MTSGSIQLRVAIMSMEHCAPLQECSTFGSLLFFFLAGLFPWITGSVAIASGGIGGGVVLLLLC